jgi:hypothetical protein
MGGLQTLRGVDGRGVDGAFFNGLRAAINLGTSEKFARSSPAVAMTPFRREDL